MLGFLIKLAGMQVAGNVIGNCLSGQPLFSGFFSQPQQQVTTTYRPVTHQDERRFAQWAFGDVSDDEIDKDYLIYRWNERRGHLIQLDSRNDWGNNVRQMWSVWEKFEN